MNHPDLNNLLYKPYNAMYPGEIPFDDVSHGTHVAGTVALQTNNGEGVASFSKGVWIMPVKLAIVTASATMMLPPASITL